MLAADYKGPGGKLVRIRLTEGRGLIRQIKMLEDVPIREKELRLLVDRFFRGTEAQSLGITPDDLVKAILETKQETTA